MTNVFDTNACLSVIDSGNVDHIVTRLDAERPWKHIPISKHWRIFYRLMRLGSERPPSEIMNWVCRVYTRGGSARSSISIDDLFKRVFDCAEHGNKSPLVYLLEHKVHPCNVAGILSIKPPGASVRILADYGVLQRLPVVNSLLAPAYESLLKRVAHRDCARSAASALLGLKRFRKPRAFGTNGRDAITLIAKHIWSTRWVDEWPVKKKLKK